MRGRNRLVVGKLKREMGGFEELRNDLWQCLLWRKLVVASFLDFPYYRAACTRTIDFQVRLLS